MFVYNIDKHWMLTTTTAASTTTSCYGHASAQSATVVDPIVWNYHLCMDATTKLIEIEWSKDQKCKLTKFNEIGAWVERVKRTHALAFTRPKSNNEAILYWLLMKCNRICWILPLHRFYLSALLRTWAFSRTKIYCTFVSTHSHFVPYAPTINGNGFIGHILHSQ